MLLGGLPAGEPPGRVREGDSGHQRLGPQLNASPRVSRGRVLALDTQASERTSDS